MRSAWRLLPDGARDGVLAVLTALFVLTALGAVGWLRRTRLSCPHRRRCG